MESRERLRRLLERAKVDLGVDERVKLVIQPMKRKMASVSLKKGVIRLNKNVVNILDDDELYYILVHELVHLKLGTMDHGVKFYETLHTLYPKNKLEELESKIVKKLVNIMPEARGECRDRPGRGPPSTESKIHQ